MNIVEYIPMGHERAISREELIRRTGINDRKIREAIRSAKMSGCIIVNDKAGYFRYRDENDLPYLRSYYAKERARAFSCLENLMPMKAFLEENGDTEQITLEEIGLG